jgi:sigma-E factor negative regulatory protein RseC
MLEEKGIVVSLEEGLVWVQTEIKTTCGSCKAKDNCGTSTIAKAFSPKPNVICVKSELPVKVGDTVVIGIDQDFVILSAFHVYILPIAGFMIFAWLGEILLGSTQLSGELATVVLAFLGGWLGYIIARKKLSSVACRSTANIQLLSVQNNHIPIRVNPS